ncbi:MAG TPA: ABC transporter ATP-binding protein [Candidatus Saccharimonadia bacterium]|nr:ABC transporter ATP-binding protein [Candidatus Saccharimonadia bacterium]
MNDSSVALAAQDVTKTYGKGDSFFAALTAINIEIRRGDSVAIVGKSGSGKSTLMHLMALMDKPSKGSIWIGGENASSLKGRKLNLMRNRTFGFVFQQFFLNGNASVLENVILPLKIAGIGSRERKNKGLAALKAVELDDKAKSKANDLSGGQKQRVVIARALINNPEIIFADEPTGNLDSATGQKVEDILFDLNQKHGITLIIVTHDEDLAARCSKQIHIKDGHLISAAASRQPLVRSPRRLQL